ncbi:hypothetical protein PHMEG_00014461 [Phytophthora megakarya]|uniref:Uncharacterized protein n=1 Tax=Phytophthora megakarya TaxID=4795 RepID=A0A225W5T5_9STRA|nr:hypothetical protein PHMEG_00014461 [Phytophthora megakarya]
MLLKDDVSETTNAMLKPENDQSESISLYLYISPRLMQLPTPRAKGKGLPFGPDTENWNGHWNDSLYNVVGYMRIRYLRKLITM